ncbi:DNA damage-regulated autophagy modulator protein 2-like [Acipenser oxyrinchus oxyrinchus]|uniref:DNA damage-regulated autophagy modulator protein 2-like n=1 Tax=Acipenser oxyrinchus oxyrinchus TaxID=40147 RepID=A0AAD8CJP4_ACIOX|nr:DNA damage-regulated autophagy modulator protein 2-like [Acipenser oxyrinchus oxyrinchus]
MWWFQQGLCFLPAATVVWSSSTFIFSYVIAVLLRHVDPLVPYISDTGAMAPERCVFGIMLNISSFLGVATVYVRYKQVMALNPDKPRLLQLNTVGLVLGLISSFGLCIVANFQKNTMISMHLVGAILTFGIGTLYILFQTIISHKMQPHIHGMGVFWVRLCLGLWCSASIVTMFVSSVIMYSSLPGVDVAKKLHWNPEETGYSAHIVSTISEWSLAFSFLSFFLTYIQDFQKITLRAEATLQSRHLFNGPQFNVNVRTYNGETTPLLAGSI